MTFNLRHFQYLHVGEGYDAQKENCFIFRLKGETADIKVSVRRFLSDVRLLGNFFTDASWRISTLNCKMHWLIRDYILCSIILSLSQGMESNNCTDYHNVGIPEGCSKFEIHEGDVCYYKLRNDRWEATIKCKNGFSLHGPWTRKYTRFRLSRPQISWSWDENHNECVPKKATSSTTTAKLYGSSHQYMARTTSNPNQGSTTSTTMRLQTSALTASSTQKLTVLETTVSNTVAIINPDTNRDLKRIEDKFHGLRLAVYTVTPLAILVLFGIAVMLLLVCRKRNAERNSLSTSTVLSEMTINNMAYDNFVFSNVAGAVAEIGNADLHFTDSDYCSAVGQHNNIHVTDNHGPESHCHETVVNVIRDDYIVVNAQDKSNLVGAGSFNDDSYATADVENLHHRLRANEHDENAMYDQSKAYIARGGNGSFYDRVRVTEHEDDGYDHTRLFNKEYEAGVSRCRREDYGYCSLSKSNSYDIRGDTHYDHTRFVQGINEVQETSNDYNVIQGEEQIHGTEFNLAADDDLNDHPNA